MYYDNKRNYKRNYNFNSIGDLLDYRKFLRSEIEKYSRYNLSISGYYFFYVRYCIGLLSLVNSLIRKKGYK